MAIKDVFKVSRKTFFNPSAWFGYQNLSSGSKMLWGMIKTTFTPDKPEREESFDEAIQRLQLTEADVQSRSHTYLLYSIGFVILAIGALMASFYYLFVHHTVAGFLLGCAVTAFLLGQAFRFHFWHFQMKHRKLGCTVNEWRRGIITESKE